MSKVVEIRQVSQGDLDRGCGQACVACLLGISLEEAVTRVGHRRGTKTKEIVKALGVTGRLVQTRHRQPTELCLLKVSFPETRNWHWVVKDGDTVMDPAFLYRLDYPVWCAFQSDGGARVTSFLDLTPFYRQVS